MPIAGVWAEGLGPMVLIALIAWAVCTARTNMGLIDVFWPLFFLAGATLYAILSPAKSLGGYLMLVLLGLWAIRLSVHLALRNWRGPEDRRYRVIRARNEPGFAWKSLAVVALPQALLAWIVSAPIAAGMASVMTGLTGVGMALTLFGIAYESVADWQLAAFLAGERRTDQVLDRGLWRFSRHPNYFGEWCVWWGFFLVSARWATIWTIFSPLLMSLLLLRVSGITLLESDIASRRPAYGRYVQRTPAFFPRWVPGDPEASSNE